PPGPVIIQAVGRRARGPRLGPGLGNDDGLAAGGALGLPAGVLGLNLELLAARTAEANPARRRHRWRGRRLGPSSWDHQKLATSRTFGSFAGVFWLGLQGSTTGTSKLNGHDGSTLRLQRSGASLPGVIERIPDPVLDRKDGRPEGRRRTSQQAGLLL